MEQTYVRCQVSFVGKSKMTYVKPHILRGNMSEVKYLMLEEKYAKYKLSDVVRRTCQI